MKRCKYYKSKLGDKCDLSYAFLDKENQLWFVYTNNIKYKSTLRYNFNEEILEKYYKEISAAEVALL